MHIIDINNSNLFYILSRLIFEDYMDRRGIRQEFEDYFSNFPDGEDVIIDNISSLLGCNFVPEEYFYYGKSDCHFDKFNFYPQFKETIFKQNSPFPYSDDFFIAAIKSISAFLKEDHPFADIYLYDLDIQDEIINAQLKIFRKYVTEQKYHNMINDLKNLRDEKLEYLFFTATENNNAFLEQFNVRIKKTVNAVKSIHKLNSKDSINVELTDARVLKVELFINDKNFIVLLTKSDENKWVKTHLIFEHSPFIDTLCELLPPPDMFLLFSALNQISSFNFLQNQ